MVSSQTGIAVAVTGFGGLLVWSGIRNQQIGTALLSLLKGTAPPPGTPQKLFSSSNSNSSSTSTGGTSNVSSLGNPTSQSTSANQALGQRMAAAYGWGSGPEWTAFNNVVMAESGWDAYAANPTSDARGIAQNINGWSSDYQPGNAAQQIAWMLAYIKQRYGDPIAAWQFHLANNWY